jgi:hypothetical protein
MNKYQIHKSWTIAEKHPLFVALSWVSLAVSKDPSRTAIAHLRIEYSEDNSTYDMVGTDGRRMHYAQYDSGMFDDDIDEILPGNYEVVARSSKFLVLCQPSGIVNFPNWRAIFPMDKEAVQSVNVTHRTTASICLATGQLMATDFLTEACGFGIVSKKSDSAVIYYLAGKDGEAILLQHEVGKAIVMPMRFDKPEEKDEIKATAIISALASYVPKDKPDASDPDDEEKDEEPDLYPPALVGLPSGEPSEEGGEA